MTENFEQLLNEHLPEAQLKIGDVIQAVVVGIADEYITLNSGLKSDSLVSIRDFKAPDGSLEVAIGDEVSVTLEAIEDGYGSTRLSREKAKRAESWLNLAHAFENDAIVLGVMQERVKGGFTVELGSVKAFLPGSLVDVRPVRDPTHLQGKELEFKIVNMDQRRNNVVVSRRAVVEGESMAERDSLLESLEEGQQIKGVVKNLTDYGAFVDLGGIDGLLHITDMSWGRINHPSEMLTVGDEIEVRILKYDREKSRVSLGLKQLHEDPWLNVTRRYPVGSRLFGKVTNLTEYGCFVEIEAGVEGLVHMSEMDWTNKNVHPGKVVQVGNEVEVLVLDIDEQRRRVSLGIKQCMPNPWVEFSENHQLNSKITGTIKSITDFGIFIGLEGGIDGLIRAADISWGATPEQALRKYTKGDDIEAIILTIDSERERISLGLKQMESDPFAAFQADHPKGSQMDAKVALVGNEGVTFALADDVKGLAHTAELERSSVEDPASTYKVDDIVPVWLGGIDRKNGAVQVFLTEPPKDAFKSKARKAAPKDDMPRNATLGDLLKEKMDGKPDDQ